MTPSTARAFLSQAQAQSVLRADTSDPNQLDADNDGVACEEFEGSYPYPNDKDENAVFRTVATANTSIYSDAYSNFDPDVTTPTPTPGPQSFIGQGDKYNCIDFASQAFAQAVLRADPSDPNQLDAGSPQWSNIPDGIACDSSYEAPEWAAGFFYPPPLDMTPVAAHVKATPLATYTPTPRTTR